MDSVPPIFPAILATCRQIYQEASEVLYGENVFALQVELLEDTPYAATLTSSGMSWGFATSHLPYAKVRCWRVTVHVYDQEDGTNHFHQVRSTLRKACEVLAVSPKLKHLHIELEPTWYRDMPSRHEVLQPFNLLRNVHKVSFNREVPADYSSQLKAIMEGDSPLSPLPLMMKVLDDYASPFKACKRLLEKAENAMEALKMKDFKKTRTTIIKKVEATMTEKGDRLYIHDEEEG